MVVACDYWTYRRGFYTDENKGRFRLALDLLDIFGNIPSHAPANAVAQHFRDSGTCRCRVRRRRCVLGWRIILNRVCVQRYSSGEWWLRLCQIFALWLRTMMGCGSGSRTVKQLNALKIINFYIERKTKQKQNFLHQGHPEGPLSDSDKSV